APAIDSAEGTRLCEVRHGARAEPGPRHHGPAGGHARASLRAGDRGPCGTVAAYEALRQPAHSRERWQRDRRGRSVPESDPGPVESRGPPRARPRRHADPLRVAPKRGHSHFVPHPDNRAAERVTLTVRSHLRTNARPKG